MEVSGKNKSESQNNEENQGEEDEIDIIRKGNNPQNRRDRRNIAEFNMKELSCNHPESWMDNYYLIIAICDVISELSSGTQN